MGLEAKLKYMSRRAATRVNRDFAARMRDMSRLVGVALATGRWQALSVKTKKDFADAIDAARFAADVADAVECVDRCLLGAATGRVCDLRIRAPSLPDIQHRILDLFDTGVVPTRGFVYVAWTEKPVHYAYVGKASTTGRLNLASHGKLAHAVAYASTVSLLFPAKSREETLLDLEASVIRLIEHQTGRLPELNVKPEQVPSGQASDQLEQLAIFLDDLADQLDPYDDR